MGQVDDMMDVKNRILRMNTPSGVNSLGVSAKGASEVNSLNPNKINFSQRSVSENVVKYTEDMKSGNWD